MHTVLAQLEGTPWLVANLLYGSGLRLMEALQLRVKDVAMERTELMVRDAKSGRDRVTVLPTSIVESFAAAPCETLAHKFPHYSKPWGWQYVFPAASLCEDLYTGKTVRHHIHEKAVLRAVQSAVIYTHVLGKGAMAVKSPGSDEGGVRAAMTDVSQSLHTRYFENRALPLYCRRRCTFSH